MKKNVKIQTPEERLFQEKNEELNCYYEEYHSCKRSWKMGCLVGTPVGAALSFLISGCRFDSTFFILLPFLVISGIQFMAAFFAMRYTADFGLSCIPRGIYAVGTAGLRIFAGTYVLVGFAIFLYSLGIVAWLFGMCFFSFLFPLETLYYYLRYKLEEKKIRKMLRKGQFAMA